MKRTMYAVATLAVSLLVGATSAQAQLEEDDEFDEQPVRTFSFGIAGGASLPMGDFGDGADVGFNGKLLLGIRPPNWPVGLRAEGMFHRFGLTDVDANINMFAGVGNVVLTVPTTGVIRPYIIGGGGMYNSRFDGDDEDLDLGSENSSTDFGINGGAGITFQLSGFNTFLEARFHNIFPEDESTQMSPITFALVF